LATASALGAAAVALANVVGAASILEFDIWMRRIDKRTQAVHRAIGRRDAATAVAEAKEIADLYRLVEDYFAKAESADDAVGLSKAGQAFAGVIVTAVGRDDFEAASEAALGITHACAACHDAYKPLE
jgi:hypothetical protein